MLSRSSPLRQRLFLLAVAVALPLLLCGSAALYFVVKEERKSLEDAHLDTTRAMSAAVDSELLAVVAAAQAIAQSAAIDEERFDRLYELARRVNEEQPSWLTVSLTSAAGERIFNLLRPFGEALPALPDKASFEKVRRTLRPAFGNVFTNDLDGAALFLVRVPVLRDGALRFVLSVGVRPQAMLSLIERQKVPGEAVAAVVDDSGTVAARSRRHEEYVGRPVTPDLRQALERRGEGFAMLGTLDGQRAYAAYTRSPVTGWSVALGLPAEAIQKPLRQALALAALGLALSVCLGVLAAIAIARGITGPVEQLGRAAEAVGRGDPPVFPSGGIPEVQQVAATLADALEKRRSAENEKDRLLRSEREARSDAEEASRQKDQFLAMLGHELRNPLAATSNAVHLLLRDPPPEVARHAHELLARQVSHLAHVIDDLLQVGRVISGKIELDRIPVELRALVDAVLASLRAAGRLEERRVEVQADLTWVSGDVHRLEQVLSNLLVNAVKYTRPGGRIRVKACREGADAVLRIEDDGIGMEREVAGRVFELFYQADDSIRRSDGGLGLGLALVRRLVDLHGGSVTAESAGAGKGSAFIVRLPALGAAPAPRQRPAEAAPAPARSILVVEDNADARTTLVALLSLDGHSVHEAGDGLAGVETALRAKPEVAFVDLGLPGIDGYECARRIRAALGADIVLVALSGYGLKEHRRRALEAGFDAHLTKPAAPGAIRAALSAPEQLDA